MAVASPVPSAPAPAAPSLPRGSTSSTGSTSDPPSSSALAPARRVLAYTYRHVCGSDPRRYQSWLLWLAWLVQRPTLPTGVVPVLRGGLGQGIWRYLFLLRSLFAGTATHVSGLEAWLGLTPAPTPLMTLDLPVRGAGRTDPKSTLVLQEALRYGTHVVVMAGPRWLWPTPEHPHFRPWMLDVADLPFTLADERALQTEWDAGGRAALLAHLQARPLPEHFPALPPQELLTEQIRLSHWKVADWWGEALMLGTIDGAFHPRVVTADTDPWPAQLSCRTLYFAYLRYQITQHPRLAGVSMPKLARLFGTVGPVMTQLHRLLPACTVRLSRREFRTRRRLWDAEPVRQKGLGIALPSLALCRAEYDRVTGIPHAWPPTVEVSHAH